MKQSISYLPKRKQDDIHYLVRAVLEKLPETQMIILYGSYATGKYVDYDERVEFGIRTSYMSDYDILVVTHNVTDRRAEQKLDSVEHKYYTNPETQTPVQFINDDIKRLNKALSEGRYFYTQLKKEGILLYDTKNYKLARRRKLKYDEIKQQAQEYFDEKFDRANSFIRSAKHDCSDKDLKMASFHFHQACENFFNAVNLTFTLMNNKQHDLLKLLNHVKRYSEDFIKIFPRDTDEDKRLFKLLRAAYIEARYNPHFKVTKEDIDSLTPAIDQLSLLVKRICEERIREYGQME
jgi:HEPN domain-containing protein/predicted nucleotidyltransferase